MILIKQSNYKKYINYKFHNINNLKDLNFKNNIMFNVVIFNKKLTFIYILLYILSISKNKILIINNINTINKNIKIMHHLTSISYVISNKMDSLSNWYILKSQIILLKWLFYLINLIILKKIKLPFKNTLSLYKIFIKLKCKYWNLINLTHPDYIFIFYKNINKNIIQKYNKLNKIFFILNDKQYKIFTNSCIYINNILCYEIILEIITTSYIHGKLFR